MIHYGVPNYQQTVRQNKAASDGKDRLVQVKYMELIEVTAIEVIFR